MLDGFAPEHKFLNEPYQDIIKMLGDAESHSSEQKGKIETITGGNIDFWSLERPNAGRGRKYHKVLIDEAAFAKGELVSQWRSNIRPTLVDYRGSAIALSNTNGADDDNFFWQICNQKNLGFIEFHAPSSSNPHLPVEELEQLQRDSHPLVWKQEFLAEFVDWSGVGIFSSDKLLYDSQPVAYPDRCDAVFAVIDSALKTGKLNDGTGVVYCAYTQHPLSGPNLVFLDYDLVQIEGAMLEVWLPNVITRCEELARMCGARRGSLGAFIEDKASGTILIQQGLNRGLPVRAIDNKLTEVGKSERAISVSGYVHRNMVKFSEHAYTKQIVYKEIARNHLWSQLTGFRVGVKDAPSRPAQDDLLDASCYSMAIALGNFAGY